MNGYETETEPTPDQVTAPDAPTYAIDARRCGPAPRDSAEYADAADAVYVAVVGTEYEEVNGPEARGHASRYAAQKFGVHSGYDRVIGPQTDDGRVQPWAAGPAHVRPDMNGAITAEQYRHMAAVRSVNRAGGGKERFVCFYRFRRPDHMGL